MVNPKRFETMKSVEVFVYSLCASQMVLRCFEQDEFEGNFTHTLESKWYIQIVMREGFPNHPKIQLEIRRLNIVAECLQGVFDDKRSNHLAFLDGKTA